MDDRLKRELLVRFIEIKSDNINPTIRNCGLGTLKRLFDDIQKNELETFLPNHLLKHIYQLKEAVDCNTVELWSLQLAQSVSWMFIDRLECTLREDVVCAITPQKISHITYILKQLQIESFQIEQSLCAGFVSVLLQYLVMNHVPVSVLHQINNALVDIDYLDLDAITEKRKICLMNNLKLDKSNCEHLQFWQNHTCLGPFKKGGAPILHGKEMYRVPGRIAAMMQVPAKHYGSFSDFKEVLDELRETPLGWFQLIKTKCRDEVTKRVYETNELDCINLSQFDEDVLYPNKNQITPTFKKR